MKNSNTLSSLIQVQDKDDNNIISEVEGPNFTLNGNELLCTVKYQGKTKTVKINVVD